MSLPPDNTLSKQERLYCKKDISDLLARGRFIPGGFMRCCWLGPTGTGKGRIMVSVSKKFFKRAVKRNLLKRRIRESYRTSKFLLGDTPGVDILFIYSSKEVATYDQVSAAVRSMLETIAQRTLPPAAECDG